jgi:Protein of unknown function (DUF2723)
MVSNYKYINIALGWLVFLVASFVYISCIEPTASFWDCGEYIACSAKLEVGHPPGAPTFLLLGRFFSLFASNPDQISTWVNIMSALASAGTILFMFWSLTMLGRKLVKSLGDELTQGRIIAIFASAAIGSLAYTFSDSFWFSAVEGEVYALSSFFTALVFWAILRWDADDTPHADRWIVFIAYMVGLSIGVHLLSLLTIPAIVFIIYFKRYDTNNMGLAIAGVVSLVMLGVIQNGIIPGIVSAAANYELFFVNAIGLGFNFGTIIYFILLVGMLVTGILYSLKGGEDKFKMFLVTAGAFFFFSLVGAALYGKAFMTLVTTGAAVGLIYYLKDKRVVLNTLLVSFAVLLIGYSTFFVLVIRSQANTPMDENNPENAISLLAYLNREQYGDWPLAYGQYYNSVLDDEKPYRDGNPVYGRDDQSGEYAIVDGRKSSIPNFNSTTCTIFPRMWDSQRNHASQYEYWGDVKNSFNRVKVRDPRTGKEQEVKLPSFTSNIRYFMRYQIGWMYMRYFLWNFAGKTNDIQGHGNMVDGDWQTGFKNIGGVEETLVPKRLRDNPANNRFFLIPLFLGLIGLFFQVSRDWKNASVIILMFLFTGLSIVFYLNQYPYQPRERDYAYVGSFWAFAFWIGFGVYAIFEFFSAKLRIQQTVSAVLATVLAIPAPYMMAEQGWNDHNRSDRYTARDFAKNYLATCDANGILFTNGDNDTFPLWYAQEVEGYRTDMRVLNLSLLNTDWYIDQANRAAYDSPRVPFSLPPYRYRQGSCDQVFFDQDADKGKAMSARELIDKIIKRDKSVMNVSFRSDEDGESYPDTTFSLPTKRVYVDVDKKACKEHGIVPKNTPDSLILDRVEWTIKKDYLLKADLMVLDLIASSNWTRPIYFAVTAGGEAYLNLDEVDIDLDKDGKNETRTSYLQLQGLAYKLVPLRADKYGIYGNDILNCDPDIMYQKIMGDGTKANPGFFWGGLEDTTKSIYMDENNLRFTTNQRLQMMTLAKLLNDQGKKDSAKKVLDRCRVVMPRKFIPYEPVMVYMVTEYYRAGDAVSAIQVSQDLFAQCEEEYRFYLKVSSLDRDFSTMYDDEINRNQSVMGMLARQAFENDQKETGKSFNQRLTALGLQQAPEEKQPRQLAPNPEEQRFFDSLKKQMELDSQKAKTSPR